MPAPLSNYSFAEIAVPRSEDIKIAPKTWTQLTNADVSAITFQNKSSGGRVHIQATVGDTAPTVVDGPTYHAGAGNMICPLSRRSPEFRAQTAFGRIRLQLRRFL